jgi:Berberine and berberine like
MSFALNRRTFLKSASGVLLGLAYLPGSARAGASNAGTVASSASWDDLARSLKGPLLHKDAPDYATIAAPAGGAVAAVPTDATAFVHRKALMLSAIDRSWTPEDDEAAVRANQAWLDEFHAAMQPFASDESFQNFIDEAETNYLRAYYGTNLECLVEIKRKYDPDNLFRFPQSVPLSL